jgi:hypothetical protein
MVKIWFPNLSKYNPIALDCNSIVQQLFGGYQYNPSVVVTMQVSDNNANLGL